MNTPDRTVRTPEYVPDEEEVELGDYQEDDILADTSFLDNCTEVEEDVQEDCVDSPAQEEDDLSDGSRDVVGQGTWRGRELPYKIRSIQNHVTLLEAWIENSYICPAASCSRTFPDCSDGQPGKNMRYASLTDHWYSCHMEVAIRYSCPYPSCARVLMTAKSLTAHYQGHYSPEELPENKKERNRFINGPQKDIRTNYAKIVGAEIDLSKLAVWKPKRTKKAPKKSPAIDPEESKIPHKEASSSRSRSRARSVGRLNTVRSPVRSRTLSPRVTSTPVKTTMKGEPPVVDSKALCDVIQAVDQVMDTECSVAQQDKDTDCSAVGQQVKEHQEQPLKEQAVSKKDVPRSTNRALKRTSEPRDEPPSKKITEDSRQGDSSNLGNGSRPGQQSRRPDRARNSNPSSTSRYPAQNNYGSRRPDARPKTDYNYYSWSTVLKTRSDRNAVDLPIKATQEIAAGLSHVRSRLGGLLVPQINAFETSRGDRGWRKTQTVEELKSLRVNFNHVRNELDWGAQAFALYMRQLEGFWQEEPSRIMVDTRHYRNVSEDNKNLTLCRVQLKEKDREVEGLRKELLATREREKALLLKQTIQVPMPVQASASTLPQVLPPQSLNLDPLGPKVWKVDCTETRKASILAGIAAMYQLLREMC